MLSCWIKTISLSLMVIDFKQHKASRDIADDKADELISYVRDNGTQSPEMLTFLEQPELKKEISKTLNQFQTIQKEMNEKA